MASMGMIRHWVLFHQMVLKVKDNSVEYLVEHFLLGMLFSIQEELEQLREFLASILQEADSGQAWAMYYVALTAVTRDDAASGMRWMQKSLELARAKDLTYLINRAASVLGNWSSLGGVCSNFSDPEKAVAYCIIAKDAAIRMDTDEARWRALWRLGHCLCDSGDFKRANEVKKELHEMAKAASVEQQVALAYTESLSGSIAGMIGEDDASKKHNGAVIRLLQGFPADLEESGRNFLRLVERISTEGLMAFEDLIAFSMKKPSVRTVMDIQTMLGQARGQLDNEPEALFLNRTREEAEENAAEHLISKEVQRSPAKTAMALVFIATLAHMHRNEHSFEIIESLLEEAQRLAQEYPSILLRVLNEQGRNYACAKDDDNLNKAICKFKEAARKQMELDFGGFSYGRIGYLDDNKRSFRMLQSLLMGGNRMREALIWAERERCRDLLYILRNSARSDAFQRELELEEFDCSEESAWEEIKEVARLSGRDTALLVTSHIFAQQIHTHILYWDSHESKLLHESHGLQLTKPNSVLQMVEKALTTMKSVSWPWNMKFWYKVLIEPFEEFLKLTKPKKLVFITHEGLSMLPFAAIYKTNNEPFLIQQYAISVSPSLRMHKQCIRQQQRQESQRSGTLSALVIGNPTLDLPHAEEEAAYITRELASSFAHSVTRLERQEATKEAALKLIPESHWIHIASHAVVNHEYPNGALILACNNSLTGEEIKEQAGAVKATTVVLSACQTALGRVKSEGVLGFARTFHMLGVPSVVASLWKVDDNSSKVFMQKLYEHLKVLDIGLAMQKAMVEMIETEDEFGLNVFKPDQWAPFVVCGSDQSRCNKF
ncbi:uncharacterized protein LOC9649859 isoform X2 [Selaginella moellendorffii]|uniref:uncharacterized protein LOC9649859 isoform X2 n=1 Tax=Selaginella moellendorffii TaxID=88036 RepID=UPI000D1CEDB4|nr:uncharacterized protein LOC9649859 isoform X2 [Selaginella moellendorffii]|eukprot:XP_024515121.1 uncharacterized protein LOC9649859 isoform X2 [Selaginella moellendorffii]